MIYSPKKQFNFKDAHKVMETYLTFKNNEKL